MDGRLFKWGNKRKQKEDPPAEKRMSAGSHELASALTGITARLDKIDQGLKENASKQDVTRVQATLANITNQMNTNTNNIEWLMDRRQEDARKMSTELKEAVNHCVQQQLGEANLQPGSTKRSVCVEEIKRLEEVDYNKARRSMRMWPVLDGDESAEKAARDFLTNVLEVPRITVSRIRIDFVRRISGSRRSRVDDEVLVRFSDAQDRDVVQSYATNLSKNGRKGRGKA